MRRNSFSSRHDPSRLSFLSPTTAPGELPLEIITMKAKGCDVFLGDNDPGFTLPSNIGELGDEITELNLSNCSLRGASSRTRPVVSFIQNPIDFR